MSNAIPDDIGQTIKDLVYKEADKFNYLAKSRTENGNFLNKLVSMPKIGGKLLDFISRDNVRTYIKDAILNRYTKDKLKKAKPVSYIEYVKREYELPDDTCLLEECSIDNIQIIKSISQRTYIIISEGTYLKWETALRKALLCLAKYPFVNDAKNKVCILLSLYARSQRIPDSDKKLLDRALKRANVRVYIWGET